MTPLRQFAVQCADVATDAKLIHKTGRETAQQCVVLRFFRRRLGSFFLIRSSLWLLVFRLSSLVFRLSSLVFCPSPHEFLPFGDLDDLIEGLLHLPRRLGIDAVATTTVAVEAAVLRELIRAHQREEI